jgi:NAD(P)-dependent dehydrogenase (short-subunit alcohol dehydrogenase family)
MTSLVFGKNVLITGGNTGIGRATAEILGREKARLFLACRSEEKTKPVLDALHAQGVEAYFLPLDLSNLESVRACAQSFLKRNEPLQVLVNNAGVASARGVTRQGFETTFGTNHLGHFLLTLWLRPALAQASSARVVVVASRAHKRLRLDTLPWASFQKRTQTVTGFHEYAVSKLCNVLFARELARRWPPHWARSYAVHPGVIKSDIWRRIPQPFRALASLFMDSNELGARASVRCALDPALEEHNGRYYKETGAPSHPSALAQNDALAQKLWEKSLEWVSPYLPEGN